MKIKTIAILAAFTMLFAYGCNNNDESFNYNKESSINEESSEDNSQETSTGSNTSDVDNMGGLGWL